MTLKTGKGGQYRYFTCCTKARQGGTGCKARSIDGEAGQPRRRAHRGPSSAARAA
ncbi:MAG: hypothetical protein JO114_09315 [Planctomycetaceae bacterium]|nr:hypothetical protein [Planctomycetaceae bacterium]MBV8311267.1 hypothetical protein [Planctomycetaceae bacterium]